MHPTSPRAQPCSLAAHPMGSSNNLYKRLALRSSNSPSQSLSTQLMGTDKMAPAMPQMLLQNNRATTIVSGCKASPCDMMWGSMMFPAML
mmetsp:Transcript_37295/g.89181  ORF Transcript_37295/g.89181 Transcript_37295/m.89181 type:complete len:90 (+) Transcript_37295:64-333(+)